VEHERVVARAPIVIGADGIDSTIARLVGAEPVLDAIHASAFIYGYFNGLDRDGYDWYFRPGAFAGVVPTNDDLANVVVGVPPLRLTNSVRARSVEETFHAVLSEVAPDVAARIASRRRSERLRIFRGRRGYLRAAHGPGWALVGDAASYKDPITAHGITNAFRDAELLVRSILRTGSAAAYQATRDLLAPPLLELSAAAASYEWSLHELAGLHRQMKVMLDEEISVIAAFGPSAASHPQRAAV
jgi:flavin-dependent dehydrogenase